MGRWIVILLASAFTIGLMVWFLPGLREKAFVWQGAQFPWAFVLGGIVIYSFHRMTKKG